LNARHDCRISIKSSICEVWRGKAGSGEADTARQGELLKVGMDDQLQPGPCAGGHSASQNDSTTSTSTLDFALVFPSSQRFLVTGATLPTSSHILPYYISIANPTECQTLPCHHRYRASNNYHVWLAVTPRTRLFPVLQITGKDATPTKRKHSILNTLSLVWLPSRMAEIGILQVAQVAGGGIAVSL
jgi:hypothetical protein